MSKVAQVTPNFLYVGASKAGTDWLYHCLREHPQVYVPSAKDLKFFDQKYEKGLEWYLSFFKDATSEVAIGELTHDYFLSPHIAKRIHQYFPNIKILSCLREPTDKMLSDYKYAKTNYLKDGVSFSDFVFNKSKVSVKAAFQQDNLGEKSARYYDNLKPYYDLFPRENIKVVFFDDLKASPKEFISDIYTFLGVDTSFIPSVIDKRVNVSRDARGKMFGPLLYSFAGLLRKLGFEKLLGSIKTNPVFEKLFYKQPKEKLVLSNHEKQSVYSVFSKDYSKLEDLIGKKLPEGWRM